MQKKAKRLCGGILIAILFLSLTAPLCASAASVDPPKSQWRSVDFPQYAVVFGAKRVNIRSTPASVSDANILFSASSGKQFVALGLEGDWLKLEKEDGTICYGYASYFYPVGAAPSAAKTPPPQTTTYLKSSLPYNPYYNPYYPSPYDVYYSNPYNFSGNSGIIGVGGAYANNNSIAIGNLQIILQLLSGNTVDVSGLNAEQLLALINQLSGNTP